MTLTYRAWAVLSAGGLVALLGAARPDLLEFVHQPLDAGLRS
jgi:hypothetical protein